MRLHLRGHEIRICLYRKPESRKAHGRNMDALAVVQKLKVLSGRPTLEGAVEWVSSLHLLYTLVGGCWDHQITEIDTKSQKSTSK